MVRIRLGAQIYALVAQQEEALRSDRIYVWVRIPLGVQTGRIHVSSGFFKSEEGARLNKALTDDAERYLVESLKVTDTLMSLLNASVAQLEDGVGLKIPSVQGSNPAGGTKICPCSPTGSRQ